MKLKKIASLALAGLMAVSMLAGCGDNSSNGNGTVVEPGTSSAIVSAFNDGQDENNDAEVTFSSDSTLTSALSSAVKSLGVGAAEDQIALMIRAIAGIGLDQDFYKPENNYEVSEKGPKDGASLTKLYVRVYSSNEYWSEDAVLKAAARTMNDANVQYLPADNEPTTGGETYYAFTYTGDVAMVSVEQANGAVNYYVAWTVTQTAAEKTVEK